MELRYEDGWLLEMDADAGVYDVYDEKRDKVRIIV